MVVGLAEQLIVGGSNSFTVNDVVPSFATCHGFSPSLPGLPSLALHFTVWTPGDKAEVSTVPWSPSPLTPSPDQAITTPCLGSCEPTVEVKFTGSPGKTDVGFAEQATVNCGGGAMLPMWYTRPVLRRATSRFARPPKSPGPQLACMN